YDAARALNEESLALCRAAGDRRGIAASLQNIGLTLECMGDAAAAKAPLEESLLIFQDIGGPFGIARSLYGLAHVTRDLGDYATARSVYAEVFERCKQIRMDWGFAHILEGLGRMAVLQQKWERAARILAAVEAQTEALNCPLPLCLQIAYDRNAAAARSAL